MEHQQRDYLGLPLGRVNVLGGSSSLGTGLNKPLQNERDKRQMGLRKEKGSERQESELQTEESQQHPGLRRLLPAAGVGARLMETRETWQEQQPEQPAGRGGVTHERFSLFNYTVVQHKG
ncbi:hypothetical protein AOLI_G00215610 [Acnodon oligacanthus]